MPKSLNQPLHSRSIIVPNIDPAAQGFLIPAVCSGPPGWEVTALGLVGKHRGPGRGGHNGGSSHPPLPFLFGFVVQ